jgi:predicted CopG family antitoxin
MARQISVSNEVYELLSKRKGKRSFSQVIKESLCATEKKTDIMKFAGIMKDEKEKLEQLKLQIEAEREANYGRSFEVER